MRTVLFAVEGVAEVVLEDVGGEGLPVEFSI